jgi:hypothetical protein
MVLRRVEAIEPDRRLRLAAEMRLPGRAWLEFEVTGDGDGSLIRQTATFDAVGLAGLAYWYLVLPLHRIVFAGMLRTIGRAAVEVGCGSWTARQQASDQARLREGTTSW